MSQARGSGSRQHSRPPPHAPGGVSAQRAPLNLRLVTTRYGASPRPLKLNAAAHGLRRHPGRKEDWDDWVSMSEQPKDVDPLVHAPKLWFPALEESGSECEDIDLNDDEGKGKGRDVVRVRGVSNHRPRSSDDDEERRRPSIGSLQSVLEERESESEEEGETSGADADISSVPSSHLHSLTMTTSASSSTTSLSGGERGGHETPRLTPTPTPTPTRGPLPSFSTQRSRQPMPSFSTQGSVSSAAGAGMGRALRLQQASAVPIVTTLTSAPRSSPTTPTSTTPTSSLSSASASSPSGPSHTSTSVSFAPGSSAFAASFSFPFPLSVAPILASTPPSNSPLNIPSLPSHAILNLTHSLSLGPPLPSLPSKNLLHDLDAMTLSFGSHRSLVSLPSVPSIPGLAGSPFLNDLDVVSLHDTAGTCADTAGTCAVEADENLPISVAEYAEYANTEDAQEREHDGTPDEADSDTFFTPRLHARPLDGSGDTADARAHTTGRAHGRVVRTLRSIQSLGSLRPAASLQSLRKTFARRPSESGARHHSSHAATVPTPATPRTAPPKPKRVSGKHGGIASRSEGVVSSPRHMARLVAKSPKTPRTYDGGVPGSPSPRKSLLKSSPFDAKSPKTPKAKPKSPSARLRLRRPRSHLLRHETAAPRLKRANAGFASISSTTRTNGGIGG